MSYAAALPVLREAWGMSAAQAGSISTGFQIGYAVSLLGFSAIADHIGARRVMTISAVLTAATTMGFALLARSYVAALVLYTLVALSQGGTYTGALMLIADRYDPARRGSAMGWLIASSSLSHAAALVTAGLALPRGGYPSTFLVAGLSAVAGAIVVLLALRGTPHVIHPRGSGMHLRAEVFRNRDAMRLTVGYTFHSWELLGMWAWTPAFVAASLATAGVSTLRAVEVGSYLTAAFHAMGLLASSTMGSLSDRLGRRLVLFTLAATSAACSLLFGWLVAMPALLVAAVGALYAFSALGDSPVLSAALSEAVRPAYLGAALALRSFLGFGAGAIAPLVFGAVLDATNPPGAAPATWGWAYTVLGAGGIVAAICAYGLGTAGRSRAAIGT
jgi:MFS family permease